MDETADISEGRGVADHQKISQDEVSVCKFQKTSRDWDDFRNRRYDQLLNEQCEKKQRKPQKGEKKDEGKKQGSIFSSLRGIPNEFIKHEGKDSVKVFLRDFIYKGKENLRSSSEESKTVEKYLKIYSRKGKDEQVKEDRVEKIETKQACLKYSKNCFMQKMIHDSFDYFTEKKKKEFPNGKAKGKKKKRTLEVLEYLLKILQSWKIEGYYKEGQT